MLTGIWNILLMIEKMVSLFSSLIIESKMPSNSFWVSLLVFISVLFFHSEKFSTYKFYPKTTEICAFWWFGSKSLVNGLKDKNISKESKVNNFLIDENH